MMYVVTILCAVLALVSANSDCSCPNVDPELVEKLDDHGARIDRLVARAVRIKETIDRRKKEREEADKDSKNMLLRLDKLNLKEEVDKCPEKHFKCVTGGDSAGNPCVANILVCDGENDCLDGSDEDSNLCRDGSSHWSYEGDHGTSHWKDSYPTCGAHKQSPVNVNENLVIYKDLGQISFINYRNKQLKMRLKNNGHAAQVDILEGKVYIKGSSLANNKYRLAQFHFHWGSNSNEGSEHTYNGESYPAEMHLVHFNKKYSNLSHAASKEPFGLAVLGVFIEVGKTDNPAFANIIRALASVTYPGSSQDITSVRLDTLLPSNTVDYYRYQGSLTTPPCYESVQWTVFKNPVQLSEAQLGEFRKLLDSDGSPLIDNFRPTQLVGVRPIYSDYSRP